MRDFRVTLGATVMRDFRVTLGATVMRDFHVVLGAIVILGATSLPAAGAGAAELPALVQKPTADVYAEPRFDAPKLTTLERNTAVKVSGQEGLWYRLQLAEGAAGYVRVNDVRMEYAGTEGGAANLRVLMEGKAGQGRVTETAGVRGIDESDLRSAALNQAQLDQMIGNRVDGPGAATYAAVQGWQATQVEYPNEAKPVRSTGKSADRSASSQTGTARAVTGLLGSLGVAVPAKLAGAEKAIPRGEDELAAQELALGPEIAGRILGARPLWSDAEAQKRVNVVGRWVASQSSRADLPWTFGVIDTPEVNAFAAPGGFILVTRGLYELLGSDGELAAVLGHEITHCVQRDHYKVIRKQELATTGKEMALRDVDAGRDSAAGRYARSYAEEHGATIMMTALDREAEYRADEGAEYYLARAGMNPLALYSLLQKLMALGSDSAALAQLYKTHPPLDARLGRIDQRGYGALEPYTTRE